MRHPKNCPLSHATIQHFEFGEKAKCDIFRFKEKQGNATFSVVTNMGKTPAIVSRTEKLEKVQFDLIQ